MHRRGSQQDSRGFAKILNKQGTTDRRRLVSLLKHVQVVEQAQVCVPSAGS